MQIQLLPDDGDQHVGGNGAPDLRLHRVLAGAQEVLDTQMLLDPFEEQLDLPAALVERADGRGWQRHVVGQEDQGLARLGVLEANAPQRVRILSDGRVAVQHHALVADHPAGTIGWRRGQASGVHGGLSSCDKERAGLMQGLKALEIQVAAIHHVEGSSLEAKQVQHLDIVQLAIADVDEGGDRAPQIQQCVQLDGGFGGAEVRPVEQAQAEVDGARVQRVDGVVQVDFERFSCVELACAADQQRRHIRPDAPVARLVGIGKGGTLDRCSKAHPIEFGRVGREADGDVAQAFAPGELGKGHGAELLGAGQGAHPGIAFVPLHDARKAGPRNELHDLGEQGRASIHACSSGDWVPGSYTRTGRLSSNRHQAKLARSPLQ